MVVFRCECEQVLGIEDQNIDKLGECQSCGRILRIPKVSVNLAGKLRLKAASPVTTTASPQIENIVAIIEPEKASLPLPETPVEDASSKEITSETTTAGEGATLKRKLTKKERRRLKLKRRARRAAEAAEAAILANAEGGMAPVKSEERELASPVAESTTEVKDVVADKPPEMLSAVLDKVATTQAPEAPIRATIITGGKGKLLVGRKVFNKSQGRVLATRGARSATSGVVSSERQAKNKDQAPVKKSRRGLIIAIVIILLLGGAAFGIYKADLFSQKSNTDEIKNSEEKIDGKNESSSDVSKSEPRP